MESSIQFNLMFGTPLIFVAVIRSVSNDQNVWRKFQFESQLSSWSNGIGLLVIHCI